MAVKESKIFRASALERMSSPDNLERLTPIVHSRDWIMLAVLAAVFSLGITWSLLGSIPTTVNGRGILVHPRKMVDVQALGGGRLISLNVHRGDALKEGDLIGRLDQTEISKRIEEDRAAITRLETQDLLQKQSSTRQTVLQNEQDRFERKSLEAQRTTLQTEMKGAGEMLPFLQRRREATRQLVTSGLLAPAAPDVTSAEQALRDNDVRREDFRVRLEQIDAQLKQIDTRSATLAAQTLTFDQTRRNQIAEIRDRIGINEIELNQNGEIRSRFSGHVAEVVASVGQILSPGARVLSLETEEPGSALSSVAYFPVRDGKKIMPGMPIQVIPDSVERERFGGMIGTVTSVSTLPVTREGAVSTIGNSDVVQGLLGSGAYVEVTAALSSDPQTFSGYRWTSVKGPRLKMSPGLTNVTRVIVERRAPVNYLLPILRDAAGLY